MKKVLVLIPSLRGGGAEKVVVNLVNNFYSTEYEITLMTIFDSGINKKFLKPNVLYKTHFLFYIRGFWRIVKIIPAKVLHRFFIKEEYDIEIAYLEGMATKIVSGSSNNTKKIAWLHCELQGKEDYFFELYKNTREFYSVYSKFNIIVGVSDEVIDSFLDNLPLNVKKKVISNVLDVPLILEKSKEIIDDIRIDNTKINFISVGRLVEQKGFERLIRIFNRLLKTYDNISLYILGDGPMANELRNQVLPQYKNNIYILGYKPNPYKYMKEMDCFICSSLQEGFSTAVSEAIVCGLPFITTSCSGSKKLSSKGAGIRCDNDEDSLQRAIELFINNPQKRLDLLKGVEPTQKMLSMETALTEFELLLGDI